MTIASMKNASLALVLGALIAGCGGGGTGGDGLLEAQGSVVAASGKTAPDHAVVDVVWTVSSGSPDYLYAFGSGEGTADSFTLSLDAEPPGAAINSHGIGVGAIVLMPDGKGLSQGKLDADTGDQIKADGLGAVGNFAIIYKTPGATGPSWSAAFPDGYSCARGVPAKPGETFDTFEPVDCSTAVMTIDALGNIPFPNWT